MSRLMMNAGIVAIVLPLCIGPVNVHAKNQEVEDVPPGIEDLGDDNYRIGTIMVNKSAQTFSLSGKILHLEKPLEYLAVKTDGAKGYESLLELDTTAVEFQLACILIGLDDENAVKPRYQFDEREVEGQAVEISISWDDDEVRQTISATEALTAGDGELAEAEWIYVGSSSSPQGGGLQAEMSGTLVGFVHDPFSIIEHSEGARSGSYGMITGNSAALPPEGSLIILTVSVATD